MRVKEANLGRITIHGWSRFKVIYKSHNYFKNSYNFIV